MCLFDILVVMKKYFIAGMPCAKDEPVNKGCKNVGGPDVFIPVDCSEVTL